MRQEIVELGNMGPLPPSDKAVRENLKDLVDKYEKLIMSITKPITDDEARVLIKIFGADDGFGLVWPLVSLVESAPGWPLRDCLENTDNEWVRMLKQRVRNSAHR